jgi:hypothetical protein
MTRCSPRTTTAVVLQRRTMDDDDDWLIVDPFIPTVDVPEPEEIGRLCAADGSLLFVLIERRPFGFTDT